MSFTIFNTKIKISFLFMVTLCILLLWDKTGFVLPMLLAVLLHEAAHLSVMWAVGCAPKEINLCPGSVQILSSPVKRKPEILILLMGPAINILVFIVLWLAFEKTVYTGVLEFAVINLIYGVFNLVPVRNLDGGSIVEVILTEFLGFQKARIILNIITVVFAVAILLLALFFSLNGDINYSLYIMVLYLFIPIIFKL